MGKIAIIDTETNWDDEVMSIGIALADDYDFELKDSKYFIIDPCYKAGGMFGDRLEVKPKGMNVICSRREAIEAIYKWLVFNDVDSFFAYNAPLDKNHLPEFGKFKWYDIMRVAAYNQHNPKISDEHESHNALHDALDELKIMEMLGLEIEEYEIARI